MGGCLNARACVFTILCEIVDGRRRHRYVVVLLLEHTRLASLMDSHRIAEPALAEAY